VEQSPKLEQETLEHSTEASIEPKAMHKIYMIGQNRECGEHVANDKSLEQGTKFKTLKVKNKRKSQAHRTEPKKKDKSPEPELENRLWVQYIF
jgi:hypothetical protein